MTNKSDNQSNITWVTSVATPPGKPFITIDSQRRLYFSADAVEIIGGGPTPEVMIGYDHANKRIIVGNPDYVRPANVKPHKLGKRRYTSARPFINTLGIDVNRLPLRYEYVGRDYTVDGAYAFELIDDDRAGQDGRL